MTLSLSPKAKTTDEYELLVYGQIGESFWGSESVTAKKVVDQLNKLDSKKTKTVNVRINSPGGSVADGLAIYNALRGLSPDIKVKVKIDGLAASAGSLIAMAGDEVCMPATAIMMVHGPWSYTQGNAKELRKYADVLDKWTESLAAAYEAKSKSSKDWLALLMDGEDHWYTAKEALDEGLIDSVLEDRPSKAKSALTEQFLGRAPAWVNLAYGMMQPMEDNVQDNAEAKAALDAVTAQLAEARAALEQAQARLAAEEDAKVLAQITAEVQSAYEHLPVGAALAFAGALKTLRKSEPAACAALEAVLKSANALLKTRLDPIGQGGTPERSTDESPSETVTRLAQAKIAKDPKLTLAQAKTQVYVEQPELVAALRGKKD